VEKSKGRGLDRWLGEREISLDAAEPRQGHDKVPSCHFDDVSMGREGEIATGPPCSTSS
jgi:hypothetical protein